MKNTKHKKFIYHSYSIDENGFSYHFSMDEHEFHPKWRLSNAEKTVLPNDDALLHELVFQLGMAELISYWKSACPPVVEVKCGSLDEWQKHWWKKLTRNGLGEFFYTNKIVPDDDFMTIIANNHRKEFTAPPTHKCSGNLIPVGGGKDSVVTLELLRESMENNRCYIVGELKRAYDTAKTAGYPDTHIIQVKRTIDPTLLRLNQIGYLNGHTPFSAIIAFSSLIFAYLSGKKNIVLSNESSANEGNVADTEVNHQYSKSTEFEHDFRDYVQNLGQGLPEYFSLLRPWNELQITKKFTQYPQYFPVFQSCNAGTKSNTWCCKCAKCLYVYIMLAAFLEDDVLISIFGENFLSNPGFSDILIALIDPETDKPFECVGTREEVCHALSMACERRRTNLPFLLKSHINKISHIESDLFDFFNDFHFVPQEFIKFLKNA